MSDPPTLRRRLGLLDATMIVTGDIVGAGIFFTPVIVARHLGGGGSILAAWVLGGLLALLGALAYAELGGRLPRAGGPYVVLREAFGPVFAFVHGWVVFAVVSTGALASLGYFLAGTLERGLPGGEGALGAGGRFAITIGMLALLVAINVRGVKLGSIVQNVLTLTKLAVLVALAAAGWFLAPAGAGAAGAGGAAAGDLAAREVERAATAGAAPDAGLAGAWVLAMLAVLYACGGWQSGLQMAGEVSRPSRNVPLALGLGAGLAGLLYVLVNLSFLRVLGAEGMAAHEAIGVEVADRLLGPVAETILAGAIALSILGVANVILFANARILFALARDRLFFPAAGSIHPRHGTPAQAILWVGGVAAGHAALTWIGGVESLIRYVVFSDWIWYGTTAAAVFVLRRREDLPLPYRVPGHPLTTAIFVLGSALLVAASIVQAPGDCAVGLGILLAGIPAYAVMRRLTR